MPPKPDDPVSSLMTTALHTVRPDALLVEARRLFLDHDIHHLPVVEGDRLVGILSQSDLFRAGVDDTLADHDPHTDATPGRRVSAVMREDPVTVEPGDPIRLAASMLAVAGFHSLPVVEDGRLVGLVTTADLLKLIIDG